MEKIIAFIGFVLMTIGVIKDSFLILFIGMAFDIFVALVIANMLKHKDDDEDIENDEDMENEEQRELTEEEIQVKRKAFIKASRDFSMSLDTKYFNIDSKNIQWVVDYMIENNKYGVRRKPVKVNTQQWASGFVEKYEFDPIPVEIVADGDGYNILFRNAVEETLMGYLPDSAKLQKCLSHKVYGKNIYISGGPGWEPHGETFSPLVEHSYYFVFGVTYSVTDLDRPVKDY